MADMEIFAQGDGGPRKLVRHPEKSKLQEDLPNLFCKAGVRVDFVPNVFRAYSIRPEGLTAAAREL